MQCAPVFPTAKSLLMGNERQKTILFKLYTHAHFSRNERQTGRKLSSCHTPQHAKKYALQKKTWRSNPISRRNLKNISVINVIKS